MSVYQFGPFYLDASRMLLLDGGQPVALGPKVVETLLALVEHPGDVVTKEAMLNRIWPEAFVDEANLVQNVHVLRKALRGRWDVNAIETIPRRGYRFTAEVRLHGLPSAQPLPAEPSAPVSAPRSRFWQVAFAALCMAAVSVAVVELSGLRRSMATVGLSEKGARMYEIGRYYWNMRTPVAVSKSLVYFTRVVDSDPGNARGYAALAAANAIMADYRYGSLPPDDYYARARAFAKKALALDSSCSDAYAVLGMIATDKSANASRRLAEGIRDLQRAIALDPSNGPAHEWYGIALLSAGHVNQAYAELRRAIDLDPLSVATTAWLGDAAYLNGHFSDAIGYAYQTLDLAPGRYEALETLGLAYEARGQMPRAIAAFERLAAVCAGCRAEAAALLAGAYARVSRLADARAEVAIARAHPKDVDAKDLAIAFVSIGKRQAGLALLRRMRSQGMRIDFNFDPRFTALRGDPQFKRLAAS